MRDSGGSGKRPDDGPIQPRSPGAGPRRIGERAPRTGGIPRQEGIAMTEFSIVLAAGAGVLSFLSPCVLPLVPSYLAFIGGVTILGHKGQRAGRAVLLFHAMLFILGFTLVFVALGASMRLVGQMFLRYQEAVRRVWGILIIVFGLSMAGIL